MQRQRFEFKYLVDEAKALAVRNHVRGYLTLDEAGVGKPDFCYRVNSLYLDSPNFCTFWDWVNADRNRFKLRMRFYDPHPDSPVYLEIKRRVSACILKQRCAIRKRAASMILDGQFPAEDDLFGGEAKHLVALNNFIALTAQMQAGIKALVTYLREAYIDPDNEGVRLTLDREVRIAPRHEADFSLEFDRYVQPFGAKVILELKFTNRFPHWFNEMVQLFDLTRGAAAKYCEGVAALRHQEHGNWNVNGLDAAWSPRSELRPRRDWDGNHVCYGDRLPPTILNVVSSEHLEQPWTPS